MNKTFLLIVIIVIAVVSCKNEKSENGSSQTIQNCIVLSYEGTAFLIDETGKKTGDIKVGQKLNESDTIKTEANTSVEVQIGGASLFRLKENTVLKLAKLYGDDKLSQTNLLLKTGKILANPEKQQDGSTFEVQTESITAGVRGTEFTVLVEGDQKVKKKIALLPFSSNTNNNTFIKDVLNDVFQAKLSDEKSIDFPQKTVQSISVSKDNIKSIVKNTLKTDIAIYGTYTNSINGILLEVNLYDNSNDTLTTYKETTTSGIELLDTITSMCFRLIHEINNLYPSDIVTKIGVNEGTVECKKNIEITSLYKIKTINPILAGNIEEKTAGSVLINKDEKVVIYEKDINILESKYNKLTDELVQLTPKTDNVSKEKTKEIISSFNTREMAVNSIISSSKIEENEKIESFNTKEFVEIKNTKDKLELTKNTINVTKKTEVKEKEKEKEKTYNSINEIMQKSENTQYVSINMSEYEKEDQKILTSIFENTQFKIGENINLSELNTSITANDNYIFVTSDQNKAVYCINPIDNTLVWTFSKNNIKYLNAPAYPYLNNVILATQSNIVFISPEGKDIKTEEIGQGVTYWAYPQLFKSNMYIPASKALYKVNGLEVKKLDKFDSSKGQLYASVSNDKLFIVDSIYSNIKEYDPEKDEIIWTSDTIQANLFNGPLLINQYLVVADNENNIYRFDYNAKSTKPSVLKIGTGIISNLAGNGKYVYFTAKNGFFYRLNIDTFTSVERIIKLDNNPNSNKYLNKKLLISGSTLFFTTDTGKMFIYNTDTGYYKFVQTDQKVALVGTPVLINGDVYTFDTNSVMYRYKNIYK